MKVSSSFVTMKGIFLKKEIVKLCCEVTTKNMQESIGTLFSSYFRKRMKWAKDHDIIFLRELLLFESWNHKYGSKERGNCWERISESLYQLTDISFKVTQRSVQDHCHTLEKIYKKQKREEDRQSGINPEEREVDFALTDITEQFQEAQNIHQDASEKQKKKQSKTQQKQKTCKESH